MAALVLYVEETFQGSTSDAERPLGALEIAKIEGHLLPLDIFDNDREESRVYLFDGGPYPVRRHPLLSDFRDSTERRLLCCIAQGLVVTQEIVPQHDGCASSDGVSGMGTEMHMIITEADYIYESPCTRDPNRPLGESCVELWLWVP